MILRKFTLLVSLIALFSASAFAQRDTVDLNTLLAKTVKFAGDYPIEKVYVHFDKRFYAAGDTAWFKAYVTMENHRPTNISTIVYLDIANNRDSIVQILKMPVTNGVASGSLIFLPSQYAQGNYHIRAYTAWMRNFEPDYFFNKNIAIGNAIDNDVKTNVSFKSSPTADGKLKVDAAITYNEAGIVQANKKVNWIVGLNGSEIAKGKGTTDANGILNVSFTGVANANLKNALLTTQMDMGERRTVTNNIAIKPAIGSKDVQFFPEGGELINGVRSRVAFKAIDINGLGIEAKGSVVDNAGTEVITFSSKHLGMGVFAMVPEEGKSYKANITFADGSKATYPLPRSMPGGINMTIYNAPADSNITLKISTNQNYFQANQNKHFYVIGQIGGAIFFAAKTTLQSQVYNASIPKRKFPTGLVQFTLLSAFGSPVSERLIFINHKDNLKLNIATDKKIYTTRQNVRLSVLAKNKLLPVQGNFSVSVIDEGKVPYDENNETTILSNLLLTSDLKGYIEKPNYYFLAKNATAEEDLDLLLLTQGYRRISYSNIINNRLPKLFLMPELNGIEIAGILRNNTGLPIAKGNLRLAIPGKQSVETITDMTGNFKLSNLNFKDSSQLTLSARNNPNNRNLMINVNPETVQSPSANAYAPDEITNIDSTFKPYLNNSKVRYDALHILKEVVIKSTVIKRAPHLDYPMLSTLPPLADQTIGAERIGSCPSLLTCLPAIALGITFDNNLLYLTRYYNTPNKAPVQIYVDGLAVDANYLNGVRGDNVENIEVFYKDGVSGINNMFGTMGIISITMKKIKKEKISFAQLQEMIPPPSILNFMPFGYAPVREFYSPKYIVPKTNGTTDLRTTIYWNPKVITDKTTGTSTFDFYNADSRGTYRVTIEGLDTDGNLGRSVIRYTVK
ncbi:carboxypeptidase regulatory-like domain-containing protein [Mucilaginibacter pallidiroseus]|uniref:Carboxypeptidase regulatory-like domain-containing protein n=1 Tax=Mucilaginibacter pallidiroseus TaxID=2599295 RepID=A0A563UCM1_9SPHI|nr:carboxypeptidase regulatory-like domain-containing protein [Mucilaginibacter pallidiroseus]TWR29009.1 carboxypeptidase regulatory-like domain-containing protein [Mucilaginibacter pallidiroseus]